MPTASDWFYNTWTFVDSVQVVNQPVRVYKTFLPLVQFEHDMVRPLPATPAHAIRRLQNPQAIAIPYSKSRPGATVAAQDGFFCRFSTR